ncbi:CAP domain-containing protein [Paracoccus spongiarum]|uniref:CAP domain-containing protein n=1 Tax=Paracoccus spongiarum TaxID=3064387 RepID=A0ABT9JEJ4_9RHOB|nr:CAP domain-containing protein [Paracoccus sp. 2205BS29-5]MDP5308245.1 CAP domain-containing protein [Paracoccus sp. 2205BS29-5]
MSVKPIAVTLLSIAALAGCESAPGGNDLAIGEVGPVVAPAEQALAASCAGNAAAQQQMADAVNAARAAEGKTVLASSDQLVQIAQSHACDMAATGRATVAGSNGSNVVDRARAAGYPTCGVAQLISVGGQPGGVVASWLRSEPQRVELLGQLSDEVGAGVAQGPDGRMWWSVVLGNDCA